MEARIETHVDTCTFCRYRVNDLRAFKAEVESVPALSPGGASVARNVFTPSSISSLWRARLSAFFAALKTPQLQTKWLVGATVTGAIAAFLILRPHSEPKSGPEFDVTGQKLTRQLQQPVSPVQSGHKLRDHELATPRNNRRRLTGAKKPERELHTRPEPHVAGGGQKTAVKPVHTGVNTHADTVVKTPEASETHDTLPPLQMAEPMLSPTIHQNQPALSSSQPVQPTQKSIQPPPSSVLPKPKLVPPSPRLPKSLPQLALPAQHRGIHQEQTSVPSPQPVQPSLRLPRSSPPATMPASQPVQPPQKTIQPPPQIAVAPPQPAVPLPQPTVAVAQPPVHQNEPPVREAVVHTASIHMQDVPIFADDLTPRRSGKHSQPER